MARRGRTVLLGVPVLLLLAACGPDPVPVATAKTPTESCADLALAVDAFYDVASPGATIRQLDVAALPQLNGFTIPRPTCAFEMRPDSGVTPGDVFTIENFYLDYDETLTQTLQEDLQAAGFARRDPEFMNWSARKLGTFYSAAILISLVGDGHAFSEAAETRVLDLSIGQG